MTNNEEDMTLAKDEQVDDGTMAASPETTAPEKDYELDGQLPIATEGASAADDFQALGVCVAYMNESEKYDWEQSKLLFVDQNNVMIAESLGMEMITRQVRGKRFIKKDKARWKVISNSVEAHVIWREKVDLVNFQSWSMEKYEQFRTQVWPMRLVGIDTDNYPIVSLSLKDCDWRSPANMFTKDELIMYIAYFQEQLLHRYRTEFRCKYRQKIILNCRGVGMSEFSAAKSLGITKVFQVLDGNYPETIEKCYLVESPWLMPKVFTFLKPFIAPDTVGKVRIWSKNSRAKFIAEEPQVSANMLPPFLGGSREGDYLFAPPGSLIGDRRRSIRPVSSRDPPVAVLATVVDEK